MATFVLIHGAWHGGWCFDELRPFLEAQGHKMIGPDLPGMGSSGDQLGNVTLSQWGHFIAEICRSAPAPVILCGHSRGGIVISEAAERAPGSVAALVYICAMLIPSGMSRADMRTSGQKNPDFDAIRINVANGSVINPKGAAAVFAHRSPSALAAAAVERLVAEPEAPSNTPLQLTDERYGSVARHYIECVDDRAINIIDQRRMQAMQPCASVVTLDTDHSPFLSVPAQLADALIHIAKGLQS
jgi:pimeloyl-ACP methyl ester carboxylesterase